MPKSKQALCALALATAGRWSPCLDQGRRPGTSRRLRGGFREALPDETAPSSRGSPRENKTPLFLPAVLQIEKWRQCSCQCGRRRWVGWLKDYASYEREYSTGLTGKTKQQTFSLAGVSAQQNAQKVVL